MPEMSTFPSGFAHGLSVRGMPLLQTQPGQVFYVGNSTILNPGQRGGSNNNSGTFKSPLATLHYAINSKCVQGRGDIVFVMPHHYETISDATTLIFGCADVAVVGLGSGDARPQFIFDTADTANIPVRSANMSIQNCQFIANFAAVASTFTAIRASHTASIAGTTLTSTVAGTALIYPGASVMGALIVPGTIVTEQLTGTTGGVGTYEVNISQTFASGTATFGTHGFAVENCVFRDTSSILNFITYVTGNATAQSMDGFYFGGNSISSLGTTALTTAITMLQAASHVRITRNSGVWAAISNTPALMSTSSFNLLNLEVDHNIVFRPSTDTSSGGILLEGTGTAFTGMIHHNHCKTLDTAGMLIMTTTSALGFHENYISGDADKSGALIPAVDADGL